MTINVNAIESGLDAVAYKTARQEKGASFDSLLSSAVSHEDRAAEEKQAAAERLESGKAAQEEFLKYAKMSPVERIRYDYLKSQGLDEESLAALPAELRKAIEEEIKKLIKEKLHLDAADTASNVSAVER